MPREFYAGDATAIKLSAINLVRTGSFGIDMSHRAELAGLLRDKGELFHEDVARQKFISRWGWFNTAVFALPVLFQPEISFPGNIETATRAHNCFNAILAALTGLYLLLLAGMFSERRLFPALFTLASLYGTFAWNYLRAQSYDLLHLCLFVALSFHLLCFIGGGAGRRMHAAAWKICLLALVFSKGFYFVLFPALLYALVSWQRGEGLDKLRSFVASLRLLALPFLIAVVVTLSSNYLQFGSPWNFGVGRQYDVDGPPTWSIRYFVPNLFNYFLSPADSIFIYFPPLLFAAAGAPAFWRKHAALSRFLLTAFTLSFVVIGCYFSRGGWCYGPRFFLFLLPVLSLPALPLLEGAAKKRTARAGALFAIAGIVLAGSVAQQLRVNRHPFFLKFQVHGLFWSVAKNPVDEDYFYNYPLPLQIRGIERFEAGLPGFFPADHLLETYPPEKLATLVPFLRRKVLELDVPNYQFGFK